MHPQGERLPDDQKVFRVKVLTTFLKAGVPLSKLETFRDPLEESGFRLTSSSHMLDLFPFV